MCSSDLRFGHSGKPDDAWLAKQEKETILEPELPIVDTHHHLWNRGGWTATARRAPIVNAACRRVSISCSQRRSASSPSPLCGTVGIRGNIGFVASAIIGARCRCLHLDKLAIAWPGFATCLAPDSLVDRKGFEGIVKLSRFAGKPLGGSVNAALPP